jgi:hypothetical protein
MRIIFLCGSAEPGNDGVGDYSRRLCGELKRLGHVVQILSLHDSHVKSYTIENQDADGTLVNVNRIPNLSSNKQRFNWANALFIKFEPDWISLQFVPYSFSPKGLPFWLPSFLSKLKGNHHWHIMFHELWLGIDFESSFKDKCIGKLQQLIVKKIIHKISPKQINTQNQLYQFILKLHDIVSDIVPICSNIPRTATKKKEKLFTQFVLFGTIHTGAPLQDFISDLVKNKNNFTKPLKIVLIGSNGPELTNFISVLDSYVISYEVLRRQSAQVISQVLMDSDYGICTTPYFQTEKSGIYAAYKEHQLNAICVARKWTPTKGFYSIQHIIKYEKNNLKLSLVNEVRVLDLNSIANQFINSFTIS